MNPDYSLTHIISVLRKWSKKIVLGTVLLTLLALVVSLFLPNYFRVTTSFYAANPTLNSSPGLGADSRPTYYFGDDVDLDRLFSLANSQELMDHIVKKFDLYTHYGIDPNGKKAELEMAETFKSQFKSIKTKYDAIEIIYEDINPQLAADLANASRNYIDTLSSKWIVASQQKLIESYKTNIEFLEKRGTNISDSLKSLKNKYGILDARYELEALAKSSTQAIDDLAESKAKVKFYQGTSKRDSLIKYQAKLAAAEAQKSYYQDFFKSYNGGVSELRLLEQEYIRLIDQLSLTKERMIQLQSLVNTPQESMHVVDVAHTPKAKFRPKRMIIVLASGIIAFILSILGAIMIDSLDKYRSQSN